MKEYTFADLKQIIDTLVSENGCPWDSVQTHESLRPYLLEESCEVLDTIEKSDKKALCEELGDVLLQVLLHSAIADKNNEFSVSDVIDAISRKMINRHPHIFSDGSAKTTDEIIKSWDEIKKEEKHYKSNTEILRLIPRTLPALMRSEKVRAKAAKFGFENETPEEIFNNIQTMLDELKDYKNMDELSKTENIGNIIAEFTKISHFFKINTEISLTNATEKFINRFEDFDNQKLSP